MSHITRNDIPNCVRLYDEEGKGFSVQPSTAPILTWSEKTYSDEKPHVGYEKLKCPDIFELEIHNVDSALKKMTEIMEKGSYRKRSIEIKATDEEWYPDHVNVYHYTLLEGETFGDLIEDVIFNGPATIILWKDGEKTVVKCKEGEVFDKEKGFLMAVFKRLCNNSSTLANKLMDKYAGD